MLKNKVKIGVTNTNTLVSQCIVIRLLSFPTNNKEQPPLKIKVNAGFTLIELMVTLSVLCLLLVLAIPSFKSMMLNNRLIANTDSLVNALSYARSTALYQEISVVVCPLGSLNSTSCGGSWSSGWIVITQPASGTSTLLKSQQYSSNDPTLSSNVTSVTFDAHGIATTQSNFKLCDNRGGTFATSVEVLATGFVQLGNTPGQAVWDNSALACP
ncbi:GspH/FimT family pseudopilin [Legionella fallonii]|uniref:Type II secretion system protein H n=1 Tax=Legionella fallonii LLAP-10 TaxID=1212491 RepID=A0A098GAJ6_9GAMM|nr:GspH/FimT family pseudopilin [Legionella fallonii]CEG58505.1 putative type IV prepilin [Legionella fallonii LLAP-10]